MSKAILVIGGTGKTGSRVVSRLQSKGIAVRAVSRSSAPRFDWEDESTWPAVLIGMDSAYITYAPDIALLGALERVQSFIDLAIATGVRRLVLLTGRGEEQAEKAEQVLQASVANWTIVRASWFAQNFSEGLFAQDIIEGTVHFPRLDVAEPFIDVEDIADVVTASLLDDRHIGQLYEVTGSHLITFREAFTLIAQETNKSVQTYDLSIPEYTAGLRQVGVPDPYVELLEILTTEVLDGRNACLTDGVQRALGVSPRPFASFVRNNALIGAWTSLDQRA